MSMNLCRSFLFVAFAATALAVTRSEAASVVWTIDSVATTAGMSGTGVAPFEGFQAKLRIVSQGTTPLSTATPTLAVKLSGALVTDTDFTSSITFLRTGTVGGEPTGVYTPDGTGAKGSTAPGDIGYSIVARAGPLNPGTIANSVFRNMQYDISGGGQITIVGGSFPVTGLTYSNIGGTLDYTGAGILEEDLGSGSTDVADPLFGDANLDRLVDGADYTIWADNFLSTPGAGMVYKGNFNEDTVVDGADYTLWADNFLKTESAYPSGPNTGANATISIVGNQATLTLPLLAIIRTILDDGDTSTTTDDSVIDFKFEATIIAHATIPSAAAAVVPEPSSFALLGIGAIGLAAFARRRHA